MLAVFLVGCGKSKKESVVGAWGAVDDQSEVEFFEDGTYKAKLNDSFKLDGVEIKSISGEWTILSDGRIKIEYEMGGVISTTVGLLELENETMKIIDPDDRMDVTEYTRLR